MHPVLFRLGSYTVYTYTLALVIGLALGTWIAYRRAHRSQIDPMTVLDGGFWTLLGGVLGGRLGFVALNWAYYADHIDRALAFREGGLWWHGALLGGGASLLAWRLLRHWLGHPVPDWRDLFDVTAPGLALGCAWGWFGCLMGGCAYGADASGYAPPLSWLAARLPDIYGVGVVRFVTQPLMIGWCLLVWIALWRVGARLPRGGTFAAYLLLYAAGDLAVGFLRGDGTWRWGLWISQWLAVGELCVAIAVGAWAWTRNDRTQIVSGVPE